MSCEDSFCKYTLVLQTVHVTQATPFLYSKGNIVQNNFKE